MTDPRTQIRSFPVDLQIADQRTVQGLVVPYDRVAPITELRPDGVINYRERFVRGAFERATRPGNAEPDPAGLHAFRFPAGPPRLRPRVPGNRRGPLRHVPARRVDRGEGPRRPDDIA